MGNKGYIKYINSDKWKEKRLLRLKIDKFKCQECGSNKELEVHHRNYDNFMHEDVYKDLITLCYKCHYKKHASWLDRICPILKNKKYREPKERYPIYCQYLILKDALLNEFGPINITYFKPELIFNSGHLFRAEMRFNDKFNNYSVNFNYNSLKINGVRTGFIVGYINGYSKEYKYPDVLKDDNLLFFKVLYVNPLNAQTGDDISFLNDIKCWEDEFLKLYRRKCKGYKDAIMSYEQYKRKKNLSVK